MQTKWKPIFHDAESLEEEWQSFCEKWENIVYVKIEEAYDSA